MYLRHSESLPIGISKSWRAHVADAFNLVNAEVNSPSRLRAIRLCLYIFRLGFHFPVTIRLLVLPLKCAWASKFYDFEIGTGGSGPRPSLIFRKGRSLFRPCLSCCTRLSSRFVRFKDYFSTTHLKISRYAVRSMKRAAHRTKNLSGEPVAGGLQERALGPRFSQFLWESYGVT
jgi:hypothetical protein